jgi:hypothetical protein
VYAVATPHEALPAPAHRPARDLIEAVLENMRQNLEPLKYSTLAPSRYLVYLHASEFARLEGILGIIQQQTIRALNEELARLNRGSLVGSFVGKYAERVLRRPATLIENAADWHVEFLVDADGDLKPGDVLVASELLLPASPELGGGARTRRITTVHIGSRVTMREPVIVERPVARAEERPADPSGQTAQTTQITQTPQTAPAPTAPVQTRSAQPLVLARIAYEDDGGAHAYEVVKASVSVGRGGVAYPVDIRIVAAADVSREHARVRHDTETGRFFLIDLSTLGTTLDGLPVPRGYDEADGSKRENGVEVPLPDRARIGLAGTVFLDFQAVRP